MGKLGPRSPPPAGPQAEPDSPNSARGHHGGSSDGPTEKRLQQPGAAGYGLVSYQQGSREHGSLTFRRASFQRCRQGFGTRRPLLPQTGAAPGDAAAAEAARAPSFCPHLPPEPESTCAGTGDTPVCANGAQPIGWRDHCCRQRWTRRGHGLRQVEHEKCAESSS